MQIIETGHWLAYEPDETHPLYNFKGAMHFKREDGEDWNLWANSPQAPKGASVCLNDEGIVTFCGKEIDQLNPYFGSRVVVIPDFTGKVSGLLGKQLVNGEFVDPPPKVPAIVTRAQALMVLYNAGLLDDLEAIVANHPYRPVRIWFDNANHWERMNPYINILGPELGLNDEQIDNLFIEAAKL